MKQKTLSKLNTPPAGSAWQLQEAKACLSEVVRQSKIAPQLVTMHGKPSAVVVSVDYFEQMQPKSGNDLIQLMGKAPFRDLDLNRRDGKMPVRRVVINPWSA